MGYMPGSGALSLAEMPEPSSLPVSTLDAQLVSAKEAQHRLASLQPIETPSCSDYYSRLIHDMNGIVLPSDPHFPESEESIADAGVDCGDAAHGYRLPCSHFNHWEDMITVGNAETDDLSC